MFNAEGELHLLKARRGKSPSAYQKFGRHMFSRYIVGLKA